MPLVIRCHAAANWARPLYAHLFQTKPQNIETVWPGMEMRALGDGWYELGLPDLEAIRIIEL